MVEYLGCLGQAAFPTGRRITSLRASCEEASASLMLRSARSQHLASAISPTDTSHLRQVDFATLPTDALHRYLACFDLIPDLDPSPLSAEDPGPPSSLLKPKSHIPLHGHALRRTSTASPGPVGGGSASHHRARREPGGNRRRSSRLVEEERIPAPPPVHGDVAEVNRVLAGIAERHFREVEVREVDTLAAFMCAVKARAMFKDL